LNNNISRKKKQLIEKVLRCTRNITPAELLKVAKWIGLEIREGNGDEKIINTTERKVYPMRIDMGRKQLLTKYLSKFKNIFEPEILRFLGKASKSRRSGE